MKIPDKIRFMSHEYLVEKIPEFSTNKGKNNIARNQGDISYIHNTIRIDVNLPNAEEIFWHELVHLITNHLSIEMEETDVVRMGEGLFHMMNENDLVK